MAFKRILALFGHAGTDHKLIERAGALAAEQGATLSFLHLNEPDAGAVGLYGRVSYEQRYTREQILELIRPVVSAGVSVDVRVEQTDDLVRRIVQASRECDLLMLGHEHQNLLTRLLSDSIDERIINSVSCDVLVIHCG